MTQGDDRGGDDGGNKVLRHSANTVTDDKSRWKEGRKEGGWGKISMQMETERKPGVVISEDYRKK